MSSARRQFQRAAPRYAGAGPLHDLAHALQAQRDVGEDPHCVRGAGWTGDRARRGLGYRQTE